MRGIVAIIRVPRCNSNVFTIVDPRLLFGSPNSDLLVLFLFTLKASELSSAVLLSQGFLLVIITFITSYFTLYHLSRLFSLVSQLILNTHDHYGYIHFSSFKIHTTRHYRQPQNLCLFLTAYLSFFVFRS